MIKAENQILFNLYQYYIAQIVDKVVLRLQQLTGDEFLLSGDDSGLKNFWEEICVQMQGEESIYWDAYMDTIDSHIEVEISNLPNEIIKLLNYIGSKDRGEEEFSENLHVGVIKEKVLEKAENFSNQNISKYLDTDFDEDEEYEEDEENEQNQSDID